MAFNEQNREDAYKFFVLTFNAVPGSKHAVDIVNAYNAGLNTQEIIEIYTSKDAFKAIYPSTQTSAEFAAALVANVASASTSQTAKDAAIADIVKAIDGGMSKAGVIYQVLGNLSNKTVADADWGKTVAQLNNKIAVAKALTEGDKAVDLTNPADLQAFLANVTEDVATVDAALNAAGDLAGKIAVLADAKKALAAFEKANPSLDEEAAAQAVDTAIGSGTAFDDATTNAGRKSVIDAAKAAAVSKVQVATDALAEAKKAFHDETANSAVSKSQLNAYLALEAAAAAAAAAVTVADEDQADAQADFVELKDAVGDFDVTTITINADGTVEDSASEPVISVIAGKLTVEPDFVEAANASQMKLVNTLLEKIIAKLEAEVAKEDADNAVLDARDAAPFDGDATLLAEVDAVADEQDALLLAQQDQTVLNKAYQDYLETVQLLNQKEDLELAVEKAEQSFEDAGLPLPVELTGAVSTLGENVFLTKAETISLTGFGADDKIFAGKDYVVGSDLAEGDSAKLEVFFKANGSNTDVYIEQKAFGSATADAANGNGDIFKITLTGVAADKLVLNDGFITLA